MTGIRPMSAEQYHADDVHPGRPTLNSHVAAILCQQSPAHARAAHPKLNPQLVREDAAHFDLGTVVHDLLLRGIENVCVILAPDWRTKEAREQRDLARQAGQIPLLAKHYEQARQMVAAAREQIAALQVDPVPLTDGAAEETLVWEDDGVLCRARLDWLHSSRQAIDDLKTNGRTADPARFAKTICDNGYDVQAAMYLRAVRAVFGVDAEFRFLVLETSPPYALSVVAPGPDVLELGDRKVRYALARWRDCLETGDWPAYPTRVCYAELPGWADAAWLEKEQREGIAA